jgi:putative Mg2+ transporter-C (MgtC) family protein
MNVDFQIELLLRLVVALLLGAAVGLERELQRQPAGFRTHAIVGLGAAIFTIVSAYAFTGPVADPTRIAAQIVTGIGFLGGGAILHYGGNVRGLTTAASLWAVAAIGMAAGAGLFVVAVGSVVLVIMALEVFDRIESAIHTRWRPGTGDRPEGRTEDMP